MKPETRLAEKKDPYKWMGEKELPISRDTVLVGFEIDGNVVVDIVPAIFSEHAKPLLQINPQKGFIFPMPNRTEDILGRRVLIFDVEGAFQLVEHNTGTTGTTELSFIGWCPIFQTIY